MNIIKSKTFGNEALFFNRSRKIMCEYRTSASEDFKAENPRMWIFRYITSRVVIVPVNNSTSGFLSKMIYIIPM